jgi:hypothetical protein
LGLSRRLGIQARTIPAIGEEAASVEIAEAVADIALQI